MKLYPHIEITTCCNLKCPGCWTIYNPDSKKRHMSFESFRLIVNKLCFLDGLSLHNGGEPTLNPELPIMVQWLSQEKKLPTIRIVTNGLARPLDYYERLFEYGLSRLEISVDSLSQQTAGLIRTGTRVEILKRVICSLCQKYPNKVKIRATVSNINAPSVNDLLSSLEKLGVRQVVLQPLESRKINPNVLSLADRLLFKEKVKLKALKHPKIKIDYHFFEASTGRCNVPFRSPNITVEGHMTPCCNIPFKEYIDYGSLIHCEFETIWNSQCSVEFRKQIKNGFPALCEACTNKKRNDMMFLEAQQSVKPN